MRVGVFGSKDWDSYPDIVRALTLFIQEAHEIGHDNVVFIHSGFRGAETMITEYIGKTHKFLKQKNFKIKEELTKPNSPVVKDLSVIESGIDFALIFSSGCKRTISCEKLLKAYQVPFRLVKNT